MSFNIETLTKLKRIRLVYQYCNSYMYRYSISVNLFDHITNSYSETAFVACKLLRINANFVNVLYDYTEHINNAIDTHTSVKDCMTNFRICQEYNANIIDMSTCSPEQIQNIIDANILALTRLNNYVQEQKQLNDIESM